ncbi:MAG: ATP synthase F1 subunit epsilon [Clostridia bacterium]|nr:ATP synthase F1 subunit epsilon [Clostridia bacterium]
MKTFPLQIVTPDGMVFDGEAVSLLIRSIGGDMAILAGHADFMTPLGTGHAKITLPDGTVKDASASGGFLSVKQGKVSAVTTTFEYAEDIDLARAEKAKEKAEEKLKTATEGREIDLAKAKLSRALSRISTVKK